MDAYLRQKNVERAQRRMWDEERLEHKRNCDRGLHEWRPSAGGAEVCTWCLTRRAS